MKRLIFSVLFAKSKRLDHAMILGFFIGGGLITKSPAMIFYLWLFISIVIFGNLQKTFKKDYKNIFVGLAAIVIISQGINSILMLGPGFSQIGARNMDYVFSFKEVVSHPLNPLIGNLKSTVNWLWLLFTPPVFIAVILAFFNKKRLSAKLFVLLICLAPLLAQAGIAKVYTSRYILYASIPLVVLASSGIYCLISQKKNILKLLGLGVIVTAIVVTFIYVTIPVKAPMSHDMRSGYLEEWTAGWGNKEISSYLVDLANKGDNIVVFTEGYFGTMPDGIQIYTEGTKNLTVVGSPPDVRNLPEGLINSAKTNKNFLIVNQSRNKLTQADLNKLTLINEFSKPSRTNGTHETLQFFQLK